MPNFLLGIALSLITQGIPAAPISFGALSSNDDGTTDIIYDSLNGREWLRWGLLAPLTYSQTLDAISPHGIYAGWNIAGKDEAFSFVTALLDGRSNSCTSSQSVPLICFHEDAEQGWRALTGAIYVSGGRADWSFAWFLGDDQEEVGHIRLYDNLTTPDSDVVFHPAWGSIESSDRFSADGELDRYTGWLLYRNVPIPSPTAMLLAGVAGLWFARRIGRITYRKGTMDSGNGV